MEPESNRKLGALALGLMFIAVELAYFLGKASAASGEELAWYIVLSPVTIPWGILTSGSALLLLSASLLLRNIRWKVLLLAAAIVVQLLLWPGGPDCSGWRRACEDPLQTYRHSLIFFWLAAAAFHGIFFFTRFKESIDNDPYMQRIRQHNESLRDTSDDE